MSAGYGPPSVNIFGMVSGLGKSFDDGFQGARKDALENQRQSALKEFAASNPNGPFDLRGLGTKLLTMGDLTGALTAAQLANSQEDRAFSRTLDTRRLDLQERSAANEQSYRDGTLGLSRDRLKMEQDASNSPVGKMLDDAGVTDPNERKNIIVRTIEGQQAKAAQRPQTAGEKYRDEVNERFRQVKERGLDPNAPENRAFIIGMKPGKAQATSVNPYAQGGTFNNDQGKAAGFTDRMMGSEEVLRGLEGINSGYVNGALGAVAPMTPNFAKPEDRQKFEQARRDFTNAQLRRESGAAIAQSEFDNADKQYFPQPGDKPEVIAQKRANRQAAIEAMGREGGPSYVPKKVFKDGSIVPYQAPAPASGGATVPAAAAGTPARYQEGATYRSKSTGKTYVIKDGVPVEQ